MHDNEQSPEMRALLRYLDVAADTIELSHVHNATVRADDVRRVAAAIRVGAHFLFMEDEDPAARCQARTTAPGADGAA